MDKQNKDKKPKHTVQYISYKTSDNVSKIVSQLTGGSVSEQLGLKTVGGNGFV
jgi:hypothetical protein